VGVGLYEYQKSAVAAANAMNPRITNVHPK
jgi:hypothetical protein